VILAEKIFGESKEEYHNKDEQNTMFVFPLPPRYTILGNGSMAI